MDSFTITLPLKPKVASRPRVRKGHAYLEKGYADWLDEAIILLKMIARKQKIRTAEGPLAVGIQLKRDAIRIEVAPSFYPKTSRGALRGDIDNYVKAILDAMQKAELIENDRQVERLAVLMEG